MHILSRKLHSAYNTCSYLRASGQEKGLERTHRGSMTDRNEVGATDSGQQKILLVYHFADNTAA